jgi:hypothetical protein
MEKPPTAGIGGVVTTYGLTQGVLSFVFFVVGTLTAARHNLLVSAANTALLIVLMVLMHRKFTRTHDGMMTYPQGLGSGTLLAAMAALIRSVLLYVYLRYINTGYLAAALQAQRSALEQRGVTRAQAQMALGIAATITTPVGIAITSLIAAVIGGFIVALIVSAFTQRRDPRAVY